MHIAFNWIYKKIFEKLKFFQGYLMKKLIWSCNSQDWYRKKAYFFFLQEWFQKRKSAAVRLLLCNGTTYKKSLNKMYAIKYAI